MLKSSTPRPGVVLLKHVASDTYYVEASTNMEALASEIESDLRRGCHPCNPLQEAYDLRDEVQFLLLDAPTYHAAVADAAFKKKELERKYQLINNGSDNPQALFGYH